MPRVKAGSRSFVQGFRPIMRLIRAALCNSALVAATGFVLACQPSEGNRSSDGERVSEARLQEIEERFTPGLHTLMTDLGMRHASVWFAGDGGNWELASYMVHELEEMIGTIETLHPEYDDVPVASMLRRMTVPAVEEIEAAVEAGDGEEFRAAFDRLTTACNQCHQAADRSAIVIQRPTAVPVPSLRYEP